MKQIFLTGKNNTCSDILIDAAVLKNQIFFFFGQKKQKFNKLKTPNNISLYDKEINLILSYRNCSG